MDHGRICRKPLVLCRVFDDEKLLRVLDGVSGEEAFAWGADRVAQPHVGLHPAPILVNDRNRRHGRLEDAGRHAGQIVEGGRREIIELQGVQSGLALLFVLGGIHRLLWSGKNHGTQREWA
jgi:hypothetical protein